jgi:hypothetical protein
MLAVMRVLLWPLGKLLTCRACYQGRYTPAIVDYRGQAPIVLGMPQVWREETGIFERKRREGAAATMPILASARTFSHGRVTHDAYACSQVPASAPASGLRPPTP